MGKICKSIAAILILFLAFIFYMEDRVLAQGNESKREKIDSVVSDVMSARYESYLRKSDYSNSLDEEKIAEVAQVLFNISPNGYGSKNLLYRSDISERFGIEIYLLKSEEIDVFLIISMVDEGNDWKILYSKITSSFDEMFNYVK